MSEQDFLYRPILEELTSEVKTKGLDPFEAYIWYYEAKNEQNLKADYYCSTSITSGGHARDDNLAIQDVIARNNESARILAEQLAHDNQINPNSSVEPVYVGKTGWNQAEYMDFWLSVIGGFDFEKGSYATGIDKLRNNVRQSYHDEEFNVDIINGNLPPNEKAEQYFKMSRVYAEMIKRGDPATPIDKIIRMIDTEQSLGAQTERAFARQIGSKVMNICIQKPAQLEDLMTVNRVLYKDMDRLIKFGSAVFDTVNNRVSLSLIEDIA